MAARKKAARKAAAPRKAPLDALCLEKVAELRQRAAGQAHSGTAQDLRLQAVELLLAELVRVR